ncbi:MAG TPA: DUF1491 family protein [Sphingomicrobium sp.]|nr:DUF1491 family protein [Sphingomicrobium sp.]
MTERLPAHVEAAGLLRRAEAEGGFGTILKKGDPDRGSLVLLVANRGGHQACLERRLASDGHYRWHRVGPTAGAGAEALADWSQKRVRFDEDLWLIELDIADPERFIAETTAEG